MARFNKVSAELLDELRHVLGEKGVTVDPEKLETYQTDEEGNPYWFHTPEVVVFPRTTEEVAEVIKLANKYLVPITPRAAGSGVACGAIPVYHGIVMELDKMDQILKIDEDNLYAIVQTGVRTSVIQQECKQRGLLYAGDPCSADSCQIGGNVATNAGGNKAVKYGTTRNQIYGMKIVTPTGDIVDVGARLQKCSTGYCLEQLICGSEGTLGVVTEITLKLRPLPPCKFDLVAIFDEDAKAFALPNKILKAGIEPTSIEYMDNKALKMCSNFCKVTLPHVEDNCCYVIITVETFREDELDTKMETVCNICEETGAVEVLEADDRIWNMRRNIQNSCELVSKVFLTDDVVVPVHKIAPTIEKIMEIGEDYPFQVKINAHIGDGNLHIVLCKVNMTDEEWAASVDKFHHQVYEYAYSVGGRLAGEHGIGAKKLQYMEEFTPSGELQVMKTIKRAMDPNNILNPGKLFNA